MVMNILKTVNYLILSLSGSQSSYSEKLLKIKLNLEKTV